MELGEQNPKDDKTCKGTPGLTARDKSIYVALLCL